MIIFLSMRLKHIFAAISALQGRVKENLHRLAKQSLRKTNLDLLRARGVNQMWHREVLVGNASWSAFVRGPRGIG